MASAVTTGGSTHTAREARRRRIHERGSDRLALITGQIQSLPPDPDPYQSRASPGQSPAPDFSQHEDAASNPMLPNEEPGKERVAPDETVEPVPHTSQNGGDISSRSVSQIPSSMQKPALDHHHREQTQRSLFTAGQIRSAVAASENTRMYCSVATAVLVIASFMGFPVSGIIILRPVYLLLLTNITIVLGRAILGERGMESRAGRRRSAPTVGGNGLADQLGKALELGLLMQKIIGALFMDFSIYTVVLVSGLSLVGKSGW